jgi:hypothetical protein
MACRQTAMKNNFAHFVETKSPMLLLELLAPEETMARSLYWSPPLLVPSKLEMGCEPAK